MKAADQHALKHLWNTLTSPVKVVSIYPESNPDGIPDKREGKEVEARYVESTNQWLCRGATYYLMADEEVSVETWAE